MIGAGAAVAAGEGVIVVAVVAGGSVAGAGGAVVTGAFALALGAGAPACTILHRRTAVRVPRATRVISIDRFERAEFAPRVAARVILPSLHLIVASNPPILGLDDQVHLVARCTVAANRTMPPRAARSRRGTARTESASADGTAKPSTASATMLARDPRRPAVGRLPRALTTRPTRPPRQPRQPPNAASRRI